MLDMRWYQEAVIDGVRMPTRGKRPTSAERWDSLIAPLVPGGYHATGRLFLELGANAGYHLRRAADLGYRTLGVERDYRFLAQAEHWESLDPKGARVVYGDVTRYQVPACDVCLMASVHYWLTIPDLERLLADLRLKARRLIVVGKHRGSSLTPTDRASLVGRLGGWHVAGERRSDWGWSVAADNPDLSEMQVADLYAREIAFCESIDYPMDFFEAFGEFVRRVVAGERFDPNASAYGRWLRRHRTGYRWSVLHWYAEMARLASLGGIPWPLTVSGGRVVDGRHRLVIAHELGWERVICRTAS